MMIDERTANVLIKTPQGGRSCMRERERESLQINQSVELAARFST